MQPPPQAVPSGMAGPPPAGNPQSMFWAGSPYRRQVHGSLPAAPAACPLQPVTDPFAFSRQALQSSPLGAVSRGSPPVLPGPAPVAFPQRPGPPAGAGESTPSRPRPGAGPFSSAPAPAAAPGPEPNRSAEAAARAEAEGQTPPPQHIPGPEGLPGGHPARPDPPLSGHSPYDGTTSATSFPQPPPPVPGQWGPGQGGPPPSGQQHWPGPEGPVPSTAPQASGAPHLPPPPGPSYALHHPTATASLAGPLAGDPRSEAAPPQRGPPVAPAPTCRLKPGAGPSWAASELRPQPGASQERWPAPLAPGSGPDGQPRAPPEAGSGALSMFFQGGEAENEENLSGRAGSAARQAEREPFPPGPGLGLGLRAQPGPARPAGGPAQCENMENLEFAQNQEVPPSEPPGADLGPGEQLRFGPPGLRLAAVGLAGGGGPGLQAPDGAAAAAFGGRGRGGLPGAARPQDLGGTFIQQEVGKPGEEAPDSFFQQMDSSPLGGESAAAALALAQPATPSPPKPTGVFQTSANSSFEPVRSHAVGVKPVEADRANVVGEVRGPQARQRRHRAPAPDAAPGNLEQPPDNMETLSPPAPGPRPPETLLPTPERKASARVHGAVKCESPATTLWAQNELPDFGGNVLLAPAAPALHVPVPAPARPPAAEVTQPPDEGAPARPPAAGAPPPRSGEPTGASENLENPPELGEEEPLRPQVTRDAQEQQGPKAPFPEPPRAGSPPGPAQPLNSAPPPGSQAPTDPGQPLPPRPPRSSSASVASTSSSQAAARPDPPWPQPLPPDYYYYHRALYDGYQPSSYHVPYPPDPGAAASFYYQDPYGPFEPRVRHYDSAAAAYAENYRHAEPERPSSRASHCSDRPARREHPEGYYASKGGWSDYYGHYYAGQYDYGDLGRWERYQYGSGPRDPRAYDQRYWGDAEYDPCRRDSYAFGGRPEKRDDHWRYDPRFTGSFDDDPEPRRDPYGEEADRRSERSEHSAQSLRSRRSSLSAHSQQSQVYRSHHAATSAYEAPPPAGSFHGDYSYGTYGGAFGGAAAFPDFGVDAGWPAGEQVPSRPTSPEKFSVPHPCARFGPGGQLVKVVPNLPSEGQPALVEIHSMETLLQHTPEQEEMRAFPGPLGKDDTHKVDVITFAQSKAAQCLQSRSSLDKESASLLWDFIVLLCRQNGTVVGTDIAELLLREHRTAWLPGKSPDEANLIDFSSEAAGPAAAEEEEEEESGEAQLSFLTSSPAAAASGDEKETERFRELLLYGRKKDALESAMKSALWGHALLLASKMDSRTHARVMTRFANSLPINDPLQTVYQLMSGRMPAASTCCGDEKWGDWRPHLAMVLSNLSNNVDVECRAMATMGDTLAAKGLLDAAHFCYLMAQASFGVYTRKTAKLVLIGSNHSLPFPKFATNEAIQRTEAYEYAQSLGAQACPLPTFQVFKFIYSCRLAEMGLATQAFHYCEVIAQSVLARPRLHSPVLIGQLVQMASQLRLFDPQLKEKPEAAALVEPAWLARLRRVEQQMQEGGGPWSQDAAFPQQRAGTPSSELGQSDGLAPAPPAGLATDNPLLAPPALGTEHLALGVQLLPSGPKVLPDGQPTVPARVPMFPVMPSPGPAEPGPGYAPPGPALGFAETPGADPVALYPGPGLLPGAPPPRELGSHDAGAAPPEMPGGNLQPELQDGDRGAGFATPGPSGLSPDSEAPLGWEPPPRPPTPAPETKKPGAAAKKEPREPKKSSEPWFFSRWLSGKKRTEAYLPDDKNKSIVWDEKRNRWVDVNEPEEEKTAPPPPPTTLPKASQAAPPGPGGHPRASVNMFSRKAAGARARYVDVLNPEGSRRSEPALAPADFFAPLAPLPIPAHLLGPHPEPERGPSAEGAAGEVQAPTAWEPKVPGPAVPPPSSELPPPGPDGSQGGEAPSGPPGAAVPFYNPAQFAPASGGMRTGPLVRGGARR